MMTTRGHRSKAEERTCLNLYAWMPTETAYTIFSKLSETQKSLPQLVRTVCGGVLLTLQRYHTGNGENGSDHLESIPPTATMMLAGRGYQVSRLVKGNRTSA